MTPTSRLKAATIALLACRLVMDANPALATCGGGGGGGVGGARVGGSSSSSSMTETTAYQVPWVVAGPKDLTQFGKLTLLWFPSSDADAKASPLQSSRTLAMLSAQCVQMVRVAPENETYRTKFELASGGTGVILADEEGDFVGMVAETGAPIAAAPVERLVQQELDRRETAVKMWLDSANEKIKAKQDLEMAQTLLTKVWEKRCNFPDLGKKAAKALKKMGHPVDVSALEGWDGNKPDVSPATSSAIVRAMDAGLAAERAGNIGEARRLYAAAARIDPNDATPIRFLGELYRHEIGDWVEARALFTRVTKMSADPISRAVALHGLGKMTIHEGRYAEGVGLFEQSLEVFPLALTYRNLAVYWNSEKEHTKAHEYVKLAMALDPDDEFNQIFAATYFVELGRPDEARAVAERFHALLPASYNLAVIHAQLGQKDKALELLNRHFTVYEKFDAVRSKEMQEARDDIAFANLHKEAEFVLMTAKADRDAEAHR